MKTKKVTLMFALLLSSIILSAQSFSDDGGKMKLENNQTAVPHIQISEDPNTPEYATYSSTWWDFIKVYIGPAYGNNSSFDAGKSTSQKPRFNKKDKRPFPVLPNPYVKNAHKSARSLVQ